MDTGVEAGQAAESIRHEMAQIRRDLRADMKGVVASANAITDWRQYVQMYPWVSVAAAVAVGYIVVPRRVRIPQAAAVDLSKIEALARSIKKGNSPTLKGRLFGMLATAAIGAAQAYAARQFKSAFAGAQGAGQPAMGDGQRPEL